MQAASSRRRGPFAKRVPLFGILPDQESSSSTTGEMPLWSTKPSCCTSRAPMWASWRPSELRAACALCEACPASQELAKNLKAQTFEQVRQEAIGEQDRFDLRLCFAHCCLTCQQILDFLGIDVQGGFGPEKLKAAKEVARRVADAPFHQYVRAKEFHGRFKSKDLAQAVKARGAHCIYVKATTKADERFCAASPSVHALLKRKTRWLGIF